MKQEHIRFPDIEQFRSIVREAPKKAIDFTGTVKLHGTNASVVMTNADNLYAQSRGNVITPENDNYGFARFAHENKSFFANAIDLFNCGDTPSCCEMVIFGEWCGRGIQKSVAVSELEKMFVVFAVKIDGEWVDHEHWNLTLLSFFNLAKALKIGVFSIYDFQTYKISIDFSVPELSIDKLRELTTDVERQCPVASAFGINGVGEGIVWSSHEHRLRFKVKGEKHSVSKVKTLAAVDVEKLNTIQEFLDYAVTENRLLQAQSEITPTLDIKKMGDFIRWVFNDIVKEESDVLAGNNLVDKDIGKYVSMRARTWFLANQKF